MLRRILGKERKMNKKRFITVLALCTLLVMSVSVVSASAASNKAVVTVYKAQNSLNLSLKKQCLLCSFSRLVSC